MYLGVDFGTTNSVAAVVQALGDAPQIIALDEGSRTLRTMLYVERDQSMSVGAAAIHNYRTQNVGRTPRFVRKYIGTIDNEMGGLLQDDDDMKSGDVLMDVFSDVDADAPGRLMHALKGPLATDYEGTMIFGQEYKLEALIAIFLREVRRRVYEQTGCDARGVVLGRPVNFANAVDEAGNARAQGRLEAAAQAAGFESVVFEYEPAGASLSYASNVGGRAEHVLIFDFGGGTLDLAVVRRDTDGGQQILATGGLGLAGDHFDRALFQHALLPSFGRDVKWGPQRLPLPRYLLEALGDWQNIPALSNAATVAFLREAQRDCTAPIQMLALEDLVTKGHGYDLYERVERSKVELSTARIAELAYAADAIDVWQIATRAQFEAAIAPERRAVAALIDDTLARAHVVASDIDHVVRTGGSSSIPCFVELLAERFGMQRIHSEDLFTGVAAGLAVRAAQLGLRA
ncbi:MAG: Hsp70 family protein [Chloroflexi bacterium]|nr:Hsp70 family protein [Chloroflexota bacterium]